MNDEKWVEKEAASDFEFISGDVILSEAVLQAERRTLRGALQYAALDPHSTRSGCAVTCSGQALDPLVKTRAFGMTS